MNWGRGHEVKRLGPNMLYCEKRFLQCIKETEIPNKMVIFMFSRGHKLRMGSLDDLDLCRAFKSGETLGFKQTSLERSLNAPLGLRTRRRRG